MGKHEELGVQPPTPQDVRVTQVTEQDGGMLAAEPSSPEPLPSGLPWHPGTAAYWPLSRLVLGCLNCHLHLLSFNYSVFIA